MMTTAPATTLAEQRAQRAISNARQRALRLQQARQREEALFADTEHVLLSLSTFFQRWRSAPAPDPTPFPLPAPKHTERDAA